jgi:hypothetical protein
MFFNGIIAATSAGQKVPGALRRISRQPAVLS